MSRQGPGNLDRRPIRQRSSAWARKIARWLASAGISPNAISTFSVVASIGGGAAYYATTFDTGLDRLLWMAGAFLILLRLLANMFDGMVAVEWDRATPAGALYNEAPDRISDAVILIGAGYSAGGSVEFGYIAACLAILIAYVRVLARNAGAPSDFGGLAPLDRVQVLREVLIAAIERLRSTGEATGSGSSQEYHYFILYEQYVLGRSVANVAVRHGIPEGTYFKWQGEAVTVVARQLQSQEEQNGR